SCQHWSFRLLPHTRPTFISGSGLRTLQLCPPAIENDAGAIFRADYSPAKTESLVAQREAALRGQRPQHVAHLAEQRAVLVHDQRLAIPDLILPLARESLLAYFPDENLSDGAAAVASDGYFDYDNIPPWDTWVVYVAADHLLLSWVPDALV